MRRVFVAVIAGIVGLAFLLVIAPFLLIGAMVMLLVAWQRPHIVGRVSESPRLTRVPARARSTPMRFAVSVVVLTLALTTGSVAIAGQADPPASPSGGGTPSVETSIPTATETDEPTPTPSSTSTPTAAPTPDATPVFGDEPTGPVEVGVVVRVIDGDTIDVQASGEIVRVRYIGIDTPETNAGPEWMGAEATEANAGLVEGRQVTLEKDISETDQFDRLLRYVWIDDGGAWLLVNREILLLGFAQVATFPPDVKYVDALFLPAESEAREASRGLWGTPPTPEATAKPTPKPTAKPTARPPKPAPPANCHPSYEGACLKEGIGDYDCLGGSGNGPNYVRGPVYVVDYDEFGLDRDGDGIGCE